MGESENISIAIRDSFGYLCRCSGRHHHCRGFRSPIPIVSSSINSKRSSPWFIALRGTWFFSRYWANRFFGLFEGRESRRWGHLHPSDLHGLSLVLALCILLPNRQGPLNSWLSPLFRPVLIDVFHSIARIKKDRSSVCRDHISKLVILVQDEPAHFKCVDHAIVLLSFGWVIDLCTS